jgi:hypothetical protein
MLMLAALLVTPSPDDDAAAALRDAIVIRCGIAAERIAIEHWEGEKQPTIVLKGDAPLGDIELNCFGMEIAATGAIGFTIENDAISRRYSALAATRALDELQRSRPLPVFDADRESLASYAVRIERLCGLRPRSTLRAVRSNIELIDAALNRKGDRTFLRVHCAITAASAAGFSPFSSSIEPPEIF